MLFHFLYKWINKIANKNVNKIINLDSLRIKNLKIHNFIYLLHNLLLISSDLFES